MTNRDRLRDSTRRVTPLGRMLGPLAGTALYQVDSRAPYILSAGLLVLVLVFVVVARPGRARTRQA